MLDVADSVVIDLVVGFRHHLLEAVNDEPLYSSALDEFEDDGLKESQHRSKTFSKSLRLLILCFKFGDCALCSAKPLKNFRVVGFHVTMEFVEAVAQVLYCSSKTDDCFSRLHVLL